MKRLAVSLALLLVLLPSVGAAAPQQVDVEIADATDSASWTFNPSSITVPVGSTITWRNGSGVAHTVTSRDELFDSRMVDSGKSWSHTFDVPGTYRYFCVPRPWMKGIVTVLSDEAGTHPAGAS